MSKLTLIRHTLEKNPNVTIVHVDEKNYLPERYMRFSHTVDFWIAPKTGLYTADELQDFMMELVPEGLKPTTVNNFRQYNGDLSFGRLYFDEKIGEERTITKKILTLSDEELLNVAGFVDGKRASIDTEVTEEYRRSTSVRPFPNEAFIGDLLKGKLIFLNHIHSEEFRRYKPEALQRLMSRK